MVEQLHRLRFIILIQDHISRPCTFYHLPIYCGDSTLNASFPVTTHAALSLGTIAVIAERRAIMHASFGDRCLPIKQASLLILPLISSRTIRHESWFTQIYRFHFDRLEVFQIHFNAPCSPIFPHIDDSVKNRARHVPYPEIQFNILKLISKDRD